MMDWTTIEAAAAASDVAVNNITLESFHWDYSVNDKKDRPTYYRFLHRMARHWGSYVELGCFRCWAASHVLVGNPTVNVCAIDIHPQPCKYAIDLGIIPFVGRADDPELANCFGLESVDALFIDTSHTFEDTATEYRLWEPRVRSGGMIMMDDIAYPNYGCTRFWQELKADKREFPELHKGYGFGVIIKP